jgi:hypothetical protein
MAAASYNMGRPALLKEVQNQKDSNYYNLYLNEETARYIYRILAIKIIIENPDFYGFHISKSSLYTPFNYSEVSVDSSISDLALFARKFSTNYKILRIFNPWIRDNTLTNKNHKTYLIKIPPAGYRESLYSDSSFENDSITFLK